VTDLSHYSLSRLRAGDLALYRGSSDGLPPILLAAAESSSLACPKRLEHEYSLRAELDAAWAARPIELSSHGNHPALLLEDPGGVVLDRLLGRPLGIPDFLRISISLAGALRQVHACGFIHKDIKPANILVDAAGGRAWLTGFGIASRLPREHPKPEPPDEIAGTLAYMAPEQTGRMNRSIDARSDLYSLGVTFYEMLTGTLPFTASDPMEWVHCHIARRPLAPSEEVMGLPGQLSTIIMKLLAKTAEERYQTAAGVEADLQRCLAEWELHGRVDSFPPGARDVSDRLLIPEQLYGREHEIETLLACFDRVVVHGTSELVLVSGYSGIGKSSVVHELHRVLVPSRGLYASGKFDQYKRDIPYATLAQAFQYLVRSLLSQSEAQLGRWRDSFREALGSNGQLMVNLVPEFEHIIGKQPMVPDLPPLDAKNRFHMVFRRFLGVFARREHPLALFLDDLQWLDGATLELLEHLVTHSEVRHLLLVGAYRDNEVNPSHPLPRTLAAIRETDARVHEIVLGPLGLGDVGKLIADALHCGRERATPLAELVQNKTVGNPFFAIQFLTALADEDLLTFDSTAAAWAWDIDRIQAKNYTDNVVDLMVQRLKRLSMITQDALKYLACLGNMAEFGTLTMVYGQTEEAMHAALGEAIHSGLIVHQGNSCKFLHDRIQQAAYSLLAEENRAQVHLRIGRALRAGLTEDQIDERLFEVANQFNRGRAQLVDRSEKLDVAMLYLRTGRKAKASAAHTSARAYLASGMALLEETDWRDQYQLTFGLWIERAECEFLSGDVHTAGQLIEELLPRAASKIDRTAVYQVKVLLHTVKSENARAVDSALTCLRLFGIDLPAHPSFEQVKSEYEIIRQTLDERRPESLIDLPLMIDSESQAAMRLLSVLGPPAYFTDFHLFCLIACRMVKIGMQLGIGDPSALAFALLGFFSGPVFHRYHEGYRFAKLACDLTEKHRFIANRPKVYHAMGTVAFWTQPIGTAIDFMRATYRAAIETGDLTFACYGMYQSVMGPLLRNDPLDAVWRESQMALNFAREAKYADAADIVRSQQRFIANMQGRTEGFSTFNDAQFDEARFEAQLTADRMPLMICFYWILKLKARFLSGDYAEALAAAAKVKPLLSVATAQMQTLDYFYYSALTVSMLYENTSGDEQVRGHNLLTAHREQLREWAENNPATFTDKHALVSAEIARLEGRDRDAMMMYEQAIQSARKNGFVQNEALAHEIAAGFYAARGVESAVHTYLRSARHCYLRWGALGKVRQLEQVHPWLREESVPTVLNATIDVPVQQLDVGTVVKASQAVSSEIELGNLIETLMRIAVEHAGAERGLLILFTGDDPLIAAEATTGRGHIEVTLRNSAVTPAELIEAVLHTAVRTRESVILDDASARMPYSADRYVRQRHARSVLCLPLVKQAKLVGALYLENNLTPCVFGSAQIALLKLLSSQAAISLENVRLYDELRTENSERRRAEERLRRSEAYLSEAQRLSHTGAFSLRPSSGEIYWTEETYRIFECDPGITPTLELWLSRVHPEDADYVRQTLERAAEEGRDVVYGYRLLMADGRIKYLHVVARAIRNEAGDIEFVGASMDVTAIRLAERELHKTRTDLAHVARVTSLGELTTSIAHEINQPLGAIMFNAEASLSWLDGDPPNMHEAHAALKRIIRDGTRAGEIIRRVRTLAKKTDIKMAPLSLHEILNETLTFVQHELIHSAVVLRVEHASTLPVILADKVQLQQVILNLVINGIEAMQSITDRPRELLIRSEQADARHICVTVSDSGVGFSADSEARLFNTFFTTKPGGMGMGLSICRSIIELHGGRISAEPNLPHGAALRITLPLHRATAP
jgi:predicted ATPase/signal transduction histidine kinase